MATETLDEHAADADADELTGSEEQTAGAEEQQDGAAGAATEEHEKDEKLPKDAPDWVKPRIDKLTAKRHAAEEARAQAEKERDEAKADADKAKAKYADRDILTAARKTGLLPELMTKEEAEVLTRADDLKAQIEGLEQTLEDYPEGYEANGRTVSAQDLRGWLRKARRDLEEIGDDAAELRKTKAAEMRELLKLGKAAKAKGWSPDAPAKPAAAKAAPAKVKPTDGAAAPGGGAARRPAAQAQAKGGSDFSKVQNRDDLVSQMARKYGG